MKKIITVMAVLALLCCKNEDNSASKLPGYSNFENVFTNAAKEVAPYFTASTSRANWHLGSPIYELYGVLNDGEQVGYFNLYSTLESAETYFKMLSEGGTSMTAATKNSPYDFGYNGNASLSTYDTFYEYEGTGNHVFTYAMVDDNDVIYMLNTSHNTTSSTIGNKTIMQGKYDQTSGDLELHMLMGNYVDYSSDPQYNGWELVRAYVSGNTNTHTFTLKIIRNGTGYDHNMTGYGVSQGASNYFLIKLANNSMDFTNPVYYSINGSANETELQALSDTGSATASGAGDASGYDSSLPANFTTSDLLSGTEIEALDIFTF